MCNYGLPFTCVYNFLCVFMFRIAHQTILFISVYVGQSFLFSFPPDLFSHNFLPSVSLSTTSNFFQLLPFHAVLLSFYPCFIFSYFLCIHHSFLLLISQGIPDISFPYLISVLPTHSFTLFPIPTHSCTSPIILSTLLIFNSSPSSVIFITVPCLIFFPWFSHVLLLFFPEHPL